MSKRLLNLAFAMEFAKPKYILLLNHAFAMEFAKSREAKTSKVTECPPLTVHPLTKPLPVS